MSALKKVKDKPLLTPPPEVEGWSIVTEADRKAIRADLEGYRRQGNGEFVAELHHLMGQLGMPSTVTDGDRKLALDTLAKCRGDYEERLNDRGMGLKLSSHHYHMKKAGMGAEVTPEDVQTMEKTLATYRSLGGAGGAIAHMLYYMRELGLGDRSTPQDLEMMQKRADMSERVADEWNNPWLLYHMKKLGHPQEMTDYHRRLLKRELKSIRETKNGLGIGRLHLIIDEVLPTPKTEEQTPVPPLKDYTR